MSGSQDEVINTTTLIQGHAELFRLIHSHLKSQALRCAGNLGIPGAIHRRGGAATISDIITETGLPQSKLPHLRRLMRVLAVSGIIAASSNQPPSGETVYMLTPVSSILVGGEGGSPYDMSALLRVWTRPATPAMFGHLEDWFRDDAGRAESLFQMAHGVSPWTLTKNDSAYNTSVNNACVAETNLVMEVVVREAGDVFRGIGSLVDVGGGHGAAAIAISRAFPQVKCTVLDLPQVISQAPEHSTVQFVAGDMFDFIPTADAMFLKVSIFFLDRTDPCLWPTSTNTFCHHVETINCGCMVLYVCRVLWIVAAMRLCQSTSTVQESNSKGRRCRWKSHNHKSGLVST